VDRILIVDDEQGVREVLRAALEKAGYAVDEAADGAEALAVCAKKTIDLVVTDIVMPKLGGLTLIRSLRDQNPEARILAISGGGPSGKLNFLSTAKTFPGVRVLEKPFSLEIFGTTVKEILSDPSAPAPGSGSAVGVAPGRLTRTAQPPIIRAT
jgi:CheY-like chemotaxis protein